MQPVQQHRLLKQAPSYTTPASTLFHPDSLPLPPKTKNLTVLDLPALYTKPSASALLSTLQLLALKPVSFETESNGALEYSLQGSADESNTGSVHVDEDGVPGYLTSIVASRLAWIPDEEIRESIWETASVRMSERAGRAGELVSLYSRLHVTYYTSSNHFTDNIIALPSLTRTFKIPTSTSSSSAVTINLHEPSLTSDNLGLKTWGSSYLLSKRLPSLSHHFSPVKALNVLELGAGTGLTGLAFAAIFPKTNINLTDLPEIVGNLASNAEANGSILESIGSSVCVNALDWNETPMLSAYTDSSPIQPNSEYEYDVVLAADPLYSPEHPALLTRALMANLRRSQDAKFIVELPLRKAYLPEVQALKDGLRNVGLGLLENGVEEGLDDWIDKDGQRAVVRCWWGVWGWMSNA
jgi:predicted nicotinamide N-methyase